MLADLDQAAQGEAERPRRQPVFVREWLKREVSRAESTAAERPPVAQPLGDLLRALHALGAWLPVAVQAQWHSAIGALGGDSVGGEMSSRAAVERISHVLQSTLTEQSLDPLLRDRLPALLQRLDRSIFQTAAQFEPEQLLTLAGELLALTQQLRERVGGKSPPPDPSTTREAVLAAVVAPATRTDTYLDAYFGDADEHYIGNAGLVILWPFLGHFFARLGLLEESAFKDGAAVQRAVGLLQHAATGESALPEYLLPLNKVLCGMEPPELFDFGPLLTEVEAEECTDLLRAVIVQAPILHEMSVAGLRGTFLLRQGVLRTRDGAWLLQVERQTYDIVLDRFPWSWEWVKLPWMAAPLRVEW